VIGVILMVALTLVLASVFAVGLQSFGEGLDDSKSQFDNAVTTASANPWSGSQGDLVRISDTKAGATDVTYRINFTIESGSNTVGNSINSVYLEVTTESPDMFSNTSQSDIAEVSIDGDSDGSIDQDITNDVNGWDVQNDGTALKIEMSGDYTASADDSVIVIFEGVDNPQNAGDYDLRAETSGDGNWHYGTITINE